VPRRTLEDLLLEEKLLDEPALRQARRMARRTGVSLARAVVEQRLLTDAALAEMLVRCLHVPRVDLAAEAVDQDAVREVPYEFANAHRLLPLTVDRTATPRVIRVAMADPLDLDAVEEIELTTGCDLVPRVAPVNELGDAIQRHYRALITRSIPRRRPPFGGELPEPVTKPNRLVQEEADTAVKVRALVDLLVERGVIERDQYDEAVRRLMQKALSE
jgi:type IV pilus assembly protein PilB